LYHAEGESDEVKNVHTVTGLFFQPFFVAFYFYRNNHRITDFSPIAEKNIENFAAQLAQDLEVF
jgi:hypothetical protein